MAGAAPAAQHPHQPMAGSGRHNVEGAVATQARRQPTSPQSTTLLVMRDELWEAPLLQGIRAEAAAAARRRSIEEMTGVKLGDEGDEGTGPATGAGSLGHIHGPVESDEDSEIALNSGEAEECCPSPQPRRPRDDDECAVVRAPIDEADEATATLAGLRSLSSSTPQPGRVYLALMPYRRGWRYLPAITGGPIPAQAAQTPVSGSSANSGSPGSCDMTCYMHFVDARPGDLCGEHTAVITHRCEHQELLDFYSVPERFDGFRIPFGGMQRVEVQRMAREMLSAARPTLSRQLYGDEADTDGLPDHPPTSGMRSKARTSSVESDVWEKPMDSTDNIHEGVPPSTSCHSFHHSELELEPSSIDAESTRNTYCTHTGRLVKVGPTSPAPRVTRYSAPPGPTMAPSRATPPSSPLRFVENAFWRQHRLMEQALSDAVSTDEQTGQRRPVVDYGSLDYGHNVAPSGTTDSTSRPKQAKQFKTKTMSKPVRRKPRIATVRTNL